MRKIKDNISELVDISEELEDKEIIKIVSIGRKTIARGARGIRVDFGNTEKKRKNV